MSSKILNLIKSDETDTVDVNGEKPLLKEAINLSNEGTREQNDEAIIQLTNIDISLLSVYQINSFLSFIYYSRLFNDKIFRKIDSSLKHSFHECDTDTITKRSLLLRFVVNNFSNRYSLQEVLSEEKIRNELPWVWSDIASVYNWNLAEEEIGNIISKGDTLESLIIRLPYLIKKIDKEQLKNSFVKWYSNTVNKKQKQILQKWATNLNIKFGLSISAEYKLSNIPLFQESII